LQRFECELKNSQAPRKVLAWSKIEETINFAALFEGIAGCGHYKIVELGPEPVPLLLCMPMALRDDLLRMLHFMEDSIANPHVASRVLLVANPDGSNRVTRIVRRLDVQIHTSSSTDSSGIK